jgi:hypothetical protein
VCNCGKKDSHEKFHRNKKEGEKEKRNKYLLEKKRKK